jgi:hypothetical protein
VSDGHPNLYYAKSDVDSQQAAQDSALATHKTSGDHDARYLSISYLATLVRTAFNQTIDGLKTFLQKIIISNSSPTLELQDAAGGILARFYAAVTSATVVGFDICENNAWKNFLQIISGNGQVNFPNHDVASKGNLLATQQYVAQQLANAPALSGSASIFVLYDSPQLAPTVTDPTSAAPDYPTYEGGGPTLVAKIKLKYYHQAGIKHVRVYGLAKAGGSSDPVDVRVQVGTIHADTPVYSPTFVSFSVSLDVSTLSYATLYDLSLGIIGQMSDTFGWMREIFIIADTL